MENNELSHTQKKRADDTSPSLKDCSTIFVGAAVRPRAKNAQLEEGAKNPQLGEQKPRNVSVRTVFPQKLVQTSNQRTRNQLNNLRDGWFYTSREPGQGRT